MDDLISRQAAIEALDALCDRECEYSKKQRSVMCGACHLGSAFDVVEQLPSAQPEIVRCGDCKYFKVEHGWNCASYPICEVSPQRIITPDDYCSFAERRADG